MTRRDERGTSSAGRRWLVAAVMTGAAVVSATYVAVIWIVLRSGSPGGDAPLLAIAAIGAAVLIAGAASLGSRIDRGSRFANTGVRHRRAYGSRRLTRSADEES